MALHGGSQDRGTDQIASRAAEQAGASYYAIVQPPGLRVHLTSRLHDPEHSAHLQRVLAARGGRHLGARVRARRLCHLDRPGPRPRDRPLRTRAPGAPDGSRSAGSSWEGSTRHCWIRRVGCWADRFAGYHVADERVRLGFHPENPVNLPSGNGVQIELPPGLRGIGDLGEHVEPCQEEVSPRWSPCWSNWHSGPPSWCARRWRRTESHCDTACHGRRTGHGAEPDGTQAGNGS